MEVFFENYKLLFIFLYINKKFFKILSMDQWNIS